MGPLRVLQGSCNAYSKPEIEHLNVPRVETGAMTCVVAASAGIYKPPAWFLA